MTMTEAAEDPRFAFDVADRLRRALRVSGVGVGEMADELEVNRDTIGNWINGRSRPRRRDLRLFAMRTGFPVSWLETGVAPTVNGEGQSLPELDSNQQPAGFKPGAGRPARREWLAPVIVLRPSVGQPTPARPAASA